MTAEQRWFLQPISVPLQKEQIEQASEQAGAAAIVSRGARTFEVFWDGSELGLCLGSSTSWDLDLALKLYRQHVKVGLLAATGLGTATTKDGRKYPAPKWLPRLDPSSSRFFFVGNEQGHCFAAFDTRRTGHLMTPLLVALQRARFAWVQFEWFEADFRGPLGDLKSAMTRRWNEIDAPVERDYGWTDALGRRHAGAGQRDHPAKSGEFHTYHDRLKEHIEAKVSSRLVAMTIRGALDFGHEAADSLPFNVVEDSGEVRRGRWLGTSQSSSWGGESKLGESLKAWWTDDPRMILDMVERRTFEVNGLMDSYVKDYLPWRHSLPFVVLGREEMGLLIHPPLSELRGLKTTRGGQLPPPPYRGRIEKAGIQITRS